MSHVFILVATKHRVPRWFTEGLAVHEETQASPEWGDPMTPDVVAALRQKKLLPVRDLDRGFIRPEYPSQVTVSYFQAGRICDYIQSRWGDAKLLEMVRAFAKVKTTPDTIQEVLSMSPEDFDKQFQEWLYKDVQPVINSFEQWTKAVKELAELAKARKYDEVLQKGEEARRMYPEYVYPANPYEFLAEAHLAKGNKQAAAAVLAAYRNAGGRSPNALRQAETLERINHIYPVIDEALHRRLGDLWFEQLNYAGAIREYTAVAALNPLDRASTQYNLARAYFAAGQRDRATEHVLASLEAAPGFRPAQKLLLELEDSEKGN
jgi:tetratricopeptide (TPR) repeat protein